MAQTIQFESFVGSIAPLSYSQQVTSNVYGVIAFTSATPVAYTSDDSSVIYYCLYNNANAGSVKNADGLWPLDSEANNQLTTLAFSQGIGQLATAIGGDPLFLVEYTDTCFTTFTFGGATGDCCGGHPASVYYVYDSSAQTLSCYDHTVYTSVYPVCRSMLYPVTTGK